MGWRCSNLHDRGDLDRWVKIVHAIEPRVDRDHSMRDQKNKAFASVYFELGEESGENKVLREGGFDEFPVMSPRWYHLSGDIYGSSPGMEALGAGLMASCNHDIIRSAARG